jgi:hypothetical protein
MKRIGSFLMVMVSTSAILLAACGQAPVPSAVASAPPVAAVDTQIPPLDTALAPLVALATEIATKAAENSSPPAGNDCAVVTKDEVGTVLGEAVVEVRNPDQKGVNCVYQTKDLILEINTLNSFGSYGNSVDYMKATRDNGVGEPALDVPGLAEEAFYHGAAKYRLLLVRLGPTVYSFGVRNVTADQSLSSPANAQALEQATAELFLGNLP